MLNCSKGSILLDQHPYISFSDFIKNYENDKVHIEEYVNRKRVYNEFGLSLLDCLYQKEISKGYFKNHEVFKWLTCKPDGICINNEFLLKMKFPILKKNLYTIPYFQWIEMQLEMEVFNIDKTYLFNCIVKTITKKEYEYILKNDESITIGKVDDDDRIIYVKLEREVLHTVYRDKYWFDINMNKLINNYNIFEKADKIKYGKIHRTRSLVKFTDYELLNKTQYHSISEIKNYIFNDTLLDWLRLYGNYNKDELSCGEYYLLEQASIFKDLILESLNKIFSGELVSLPLTTKYEPYLYNLTKKHMYDMKPIILNAYLVDEKSNMYISNCILIRNDYLHEILPEYCIKDDYTINKPSNIGLYHYRILSPQFTTLRFNKDNKHIANTNLIKYSKTKLLFANKILKTIQGDITDRAYIIGRSGIKTADVTTNCFDSIGILSFDTVDKKYEDILIESISWVKKIYKSGKYWTVGCNKYMYPNLSNNKDFGWRNVKNQIAKELKDITMIWTLGQEHRDVAIDKGFKDWENLNLDSLNLSDTKKSIISNIINVNKTNNIILPKKIKNPFCLAKNKIEFFVDFETTNHINDTFDKFPYKGGLSIIFNIGLGISINNTWCFKKYTVTNLSLSEEKRIISEWLEDMYSMSDNSNVYHWSSAEVCILNNAINRHDNNWKIPKWIDLLKIFKSEKIAIKNCFNFKLKSVANALFNHGLISTKWEDVYNGLDITALTIKADVNKVPLYNDNDVQKIEKYNEYDCKVLYEILKFLRNRYLYQNIKI